LGRTVLVQEIEVGTAKVIRTFPRSLQSALRIKESFPKQYVILERAKSERPKGLDALPIAELIEKIKTSDSSEEIQKYTQDHRKTVREAAVKRLNELLIDDNEN
jgi:hypothetical protein